MKSVVLAIALALAVSTAVFAKEVTFTACTQDGKAVDLLVDINDAVATTHPVQDHINTAFLAAATTLTADQLLSGVGFEVFKSGLDETDVSAIDDLTAPVVIGTCKQ